MRQRSRIRIDTDIQLSIIRLNIITNNQPSVQPSFATISA